MTMTTERPPDKRVINLVGWDRQAIKSAEHWGLSKEDVESVVRNPQRSIFEAYSNVVGHPVIKHISGDVVVITGYRDKREPRVLSVFTKTGTHTRAKNDPGRGVSKSAPHSVGDLMKRIKEMGYIFSAGGHPKVMDSDTGTVIYTIPGTPSDWRSIANTWKAFLRRHEKWQTTEKPVALKALRISQK